MNAALLKFYLVLDPDLCGGFWGMLDTTVQAARAGITCVQLRAPHWNEDELIECARALKTTLAPFSIPLIVNDNARVCVAADAEGLHIGQTDMPAREARRIIGEKRLLGLSVSTIDDLERSRQLPVDYYGIGPVFATSTKKDAAPACGLENLKRIKRLALRPCVAIGGIHTQNARAVMRTGVDGIAVVSAICGTKNPYESTKSLICSARLSPKE